MPRMRALRMTLAAVLIATCATAPRNDVRVGEVDPDGEVVNWFPNDPGVIDPQAAGTIYQAAVVFSVFEPLLTTDPLTFTPVAAAADLPTVSSDGLIYHFTLRPGGFYSDGLPVKASDFAYGISRLCEPGITQLAVYIPVAIRGCAGWNALDPATARADQLLVARRNLLATGLVATSDRDLEIRLLYPAPYLMQFFALWLTAPARQKDVERNGDDWFLDPANYIGNGPFVLSEWIQEKRMVFDRNPRYRMPAKAKRITRLIFNRNDRNAGAQALAAYRSGALHTFEADLATLAEAKAAGLESEVVLSPYACSNYLRLNHARPPLDDPKVRLALAKSIDRDAYIREAQPLATPASSFIPKGLPGHDPDDDAQSFDLAAARRLLMESRYAGTPALQGLVWRIGSQQPLKVPRAESIVNQWRALGLEVKVEVIDQGDFAAQMRSITTRPLFFSNTWCADYPDPQNFLSAFFPSSVQRGQNDFGYRNSTVDALLAEADRTVDSAKRLDLYLRTSRIVSAEVGFIWLTYTVVGALRKPWLGGLNASAMDPGGLFHPGAILVRRH